MDAATKVNMAELLVEMGDELQEMFDAHQWDDYERLRNLYRKHQAFCFAQGVDAFKLEFNFRHNLPI